jgi:hypothetical protein
MKQPDPQSKRSKRRATRDFTGSRPVRRAKKELASRIKQYQDVISSPRIEDKGFTKPGATRHW